MIRSLYQWLVGLHPRAFRQRFAEEMLWIFDQAGETEGIVPLFTDGLLSLARQWLIRQGTWKVAAGAVGGLLHISIVMAALSPVA